MGTEDHLLLNRWLSEGDADAFRVLVSRYAGLVYATCRRILGDSTEAEDITQECFLLLSQAKKNPGAYLGPWLHRVATYRAANHLRGIQRRQRRERAPEVVSNAPKTAEWKEIQAFVDEAIAELPESLRVPLVLHYLDQQSHREIAETLGISHQAVTKRTRKAVERIRGALRRRGVQVPALALGVLMKTHLSSAAPPAVMQALGKLAVGGAAHVAPSAPIVTGPSGGLLHAAAVSHWAAAGVAAVLVLGGALYWWSFGRPPQPAPKQPVTAERPQEERREAEGLDTAEAPVPEDVFTPEQPLMTPTAKLGTVQGRVVTEDGNPVGGVPVRLERRISSAAEEEALGTYEVTTVSEAGGRFRFMEVPLLTGPGRLFASKRLHLSAEKEDLFAETRVSAVHWQRHHPIELVLHPAETLGGVVLDEERRPVAGATIYVVSDPMMRQEYLHRETQSGGTGRFVVSRLVRGRHVLDVRADTFLSKRLYCTSGIDDLEITLESGVLVAGDVIHEKTGQPVPEVKLGFRELDANSFLSTAVSGADGAFRLTLPAHRTYSVLIFGGPWSAAQGPLTLETDPAKLAVEPLRVFVREGGVVTGRVIDELTQTGVPYARLAARPPNDVDGTRSAVTGETGAYRLEGLQGTYRIGLCAEVRPIPSSEQEVQVPAGGLLENVDIVVRAECRIAGKVLDTQNNPVSMASVLVARAHESQSNRLGIFDPVNTTALSDREGRFVLYCPGSHMLQMRPAQVEPTDGPVLIQAVHATGVSRCAGPYRLGRYGVHEVVLTIEPGGSIEGFVIDPAGNSVAEAYVTLTPKLETQRNILPSDATGGWHRISFHPENPRIQTTYTAQGAFAFYDLVPGTYELAVHFNDCGGQAGAAETVDLAPGAAIQDLRLVAEDSAGGTLQGRVTRVGGPLPGVQIRIEDAQTRAGKSTTSGPDGRYTVQHLCPGAVQITLSGSQAAVTTEQYLELLATRSTHIEAGTVTVEDFDLAAGTALIEGSVWMDGNPPKPPVQVVTEKADTEGQERVNALTGPDGTYQILGLAAGPYRVQVTQHLDLLYETEVTLEEGQTLHLDIQAGAGAVEGSVAGLQENEYGRVIVLPGEVILDTITPEIIQQYEGQVLRETDMIWRNGPYRLSGLEPGRYTVFGAAIRFHSREMPDPLPGARVQYDIVEIGQGETVPLDFSF